MKKIRPESSQNCSSFAVQNDRDIINKYFEYSASKETKQTDQINFIGIVLSN